MWFAALANINVGLITVIWSINPLYMAAVDYFLFKTKLKSFHLVGTILIVACTVLLSLKPVLVKEEPGVESTETHKPVISEAPKIVEEGKFLPSWMPVLFGILTPITFCTNSVMLRFLTGESRGIGFNGTTLSMSAIFCVNVLILIFAIVYW